MRTKFTVFALCLAAVWSLLLPAEIGLQGKHDWRNRKKIAEGIEYAEFSYPKPRKIVGWVARIDLHNPRLKIQTTARPANWGQAMPDYPNGIIKTLRETTRSFVAKARKSGRNMVFAVNGPPWNPWEKPFTHTYAQNLGLLISEGKIVCEANNRPGLVVTAGKQFYFAEKGSDLKPEELKKIRYAVSGFSVVLKDGKIIGDLQAQNLAPRTGYGLTADKRYLLIVVIDGRQKEYSMGTNTAEVGEILRYYGANSALNMDGGGSSSFVIVHKKEIKMLNHQPDGGERKVGGNLGFIIEK